MNRVCPQCNKESDAKEIFCQQCGHWWGIAEFSTDKIHNCQFVFKCPLSWDKLERTDERDIRFCKSCEQNVYFAHHQSQLDDLAGQGKCVAFQPDSRNSNFSEDFDYKVAMGVIVPPESHKKSWWKFWK